MEGNIADLKSLVGFAQKNQTFIILDDAHALGVISIRGSIEFHELTNDDIPVLINPLGKAIGIMGAFVSGSRDYMEYLVQKARSYKYTTSLSPPIACAIAKSIRIIQQEKWRQEKL